MKITKNKIVASSQTPVKATTTADMLAAFEDKLAEFGVQSSTDIRCSEDETDLSVEIFDGDDEIFYQDIDGAFGIPGDYYTLADIKEYWNDEYRSDYSLSEFGSFEAWWEETCGNYTMKEVLPTEDVIDSYNYKEY